MNNLFIGYEVKREEKFRFFDFNEELEESAEKLASFDDESMERLIYKCAELHVNHIASSGDPFEFGSARPLDFGHWAAHKLEQLSSYSIRHGEAVAIGICLDVIYSGLVGMLQEAEVEANVSTCLTTPATERLPAEHRARMSKDNFSMQISRL